MSRSWFGIRKGRWKVLCAGTILCAASILLIAWVTTKLSEATLFWLKLISFSVTAAFGVAGFVFDLKDENKKLTGTGRLNLAALVLVAVIGITVQAAEYRNKLKTEGDARKKNAELLNQVERGLEPIGETVAIRYTLKIPWAQNHFQRIAEPMGNQMKQLTSANPRSSSEHTYVVHISQPGQPDRYLARFDKDSPLMPGDEYEKAYLSHPPFNIALYKNQPAPLGGCANVPPDADIELTWDDKATAERTADQIQGVGKWKGVTVFYDTTTDHLGQTAEAVFRIRSNRSNVRSTYDLSESYVRLFTPMYAPEIPLELTDATIVIGQRSFSLPPKDLVSDKCGVIIYRLPKIAPGSN